MMGWCGGRTVVNGTLISAADRARVVHQDNEAPATEIRSASPARRGWQQKSLGRVAESEAEAWWYREVGDLAEAHGAAGERRFIEGHVAASELRDVEGRRASASGRPLDSPAYRLRARSGPAGA